MKSELFRSELLLTRRFENMQRDVSQELFFVAKVGNFMRFCVRRQRRRPGGIRHRRPGETPALKSFI